MIRRHQCVSLHCDQCAQPPEGPDFGVHFPDEMTALEMAVAQGWRASADGRLFCSACGPILACEAEGHEFTPWHRPDQQDQTQGFRCGCDPRAAVHPLGSQQCTREFRYCQRCCLHESRTAKAVT